MVPEQRLRRAVDMLSDTYSQNQSYQAHIRSHWLSTFLIIAYGCIAYTYSLDYLVVFLGTFTVIFAFESEKHSIRKRENQHLEESLREIINLLEAQSLADKMQTHKGEQAASSNH